MRSSKKDRLRGSKRGELSVETIVWMIVLLVSLFIIVGLFIVMQNKLEYLGYPTFSCWMTLGFRQGFLDFMKPLFPNGCRMQALEEPADAKAIAKILTNTWFMRGQGDWDEQASDTIFAAYSFISVKDIKIEELITFLRRSKEGEDGKAKDVTYSDYAYLQKGSKGQTVCFQKNIIEDDGLKEGKIYYVVFYDDDTDISDDVIDAATLGLLEGTSIGDKLMITKTPNMKTSGNYPVYCDSPDTKQRIIFTGFDDSINIAEGASVL